MEVSNFVQTQFPKSSRMKKFGNFSFKIRQRTDARKNCEADIYILFLFNKDRKKVSLGISCQKELFDPIQEKIKGRGESIKAKNDIIHVAKMRCYQLLVQASVEKAPISMDWVIDRFVNRVYLIDFIEFFQKCINDDAMIEPGTLRRKQSILNKLRRYRKEITFEEIDAQFILSYKGYMKNTLKNKISTIHTNIKEIKATLRKAQKMGVKLNLDLTEIKTPEVKYSPKALSNEELQKLMRYYESDFISVEHKKILQYFLFASFTGLRFSDVEAITRDNLAEDTLIFQPQKTKGYQAVLNLPLNKTALKYINKEGPLFEEVFSNQYTNRELKDIASACRINKKLSFHMSRHTFATRIIERGGSVVVLQKLLGHSSIRQTMTYIQVNRLQKVDTVAMLDEF
ncbi:MAG: site-specific integrase [Oceanicaulis sp.]|nr:site-specific integrase [Oceanicaulis sp.]